MPTASIFWDVQSCNVNTVVDLLTFIDESWSKDHVFLKNPALLNWQHKNHKNLYNFLLAFSKSNEVLAILGFIPTWQYSKKLSLNNESWLAMWKVKETLKLPGLGISLLKTLEAKHELHTVCSINLSKMVIPIYKALGFSVGKLKHFVLINTNQSDFSILKINRPVDAVQSASNDNYSLREFNSDDLIHMSAETVSKIFVTRPKKNPEYLLNRYLNHPIYKYQILAILLNHEVSAILVTRAIQVDSSKVLRIVDYQGEFIHLQYLNQPLQKLLSQEGYEYIDFMQHGIAADYLTKSGFVHLQENKNDLVVPNYFEPYEQRNVTLDYAYYTKYSNENFLICKGDSDQDRPSIIK